MTNLNELRTIQDVEREMPGEYRRMLGRLPESVRYSLGTWVFFGKNIGGHFVSAILENDLVEAYNRADEPNTALMLVYVRWLYNDAPSGSWRKENLETWAEHGGLVGLMKERAAEGGQS